MKPRRTSACVCRITGANDESGLTISESGFITAWVIRLYDRIHSTGDGSPVRRRLDRWGVSAVADFLYTYGIGGSMTRQDQLTFARFHRMDGNAHRLTLINSVVFGLPSALLYFAVGRGFELLSRVSSTAELPSLIVADISFGMALVNAGVDVFRILDSWFGKRCWAPFGTMPLVLNLPTYLKAVARKAGLLGPPPGCDCS